MKALGYAILSMSIIALWCQSLELPLSCFNEEPFDHTWVFLVALAVFLIAV